MTTSADRLHPGRTHHARVILDALRETLEQVASGLAGNLMLDYGAGSSPYASLFRGFQRVITADLPGLGADMSIVEGRVPAASGMFDLVLSTQVLEHVPDPAAYLDEARRLLAPDGRLVISTHGIYRYHPDPEDFWRSTRTGMERQISTRGFDVLEVHPVTSGLGASLTMLSHYCAYALPRVVRPAFHAVVQSLLRLIELAVSRLEWPDAAVYVVVAVPVNSQVHQSSIRVKNE